MCRGEIQPDRDMRLILHPQLFYQLEFDVEWNIAVLDRDSMLFECLFNGINNHRYEQYDGIDISEQHTSMEHCDKLIDDDNCSQ